MSDGSAAAHHWSRAVPAWVAGLAAVLTLAFGTWEYRKAQAWKRAEFLASEVEKFESREATRAAMQMLDYNSVRIVLWPEHPSPDSIRIDDAVLAGALLPHVEKQRFSVAEFRIRDYFDQYFDGLERFDHYIEVGLITEDDLQPFLGYWLDILGDASSGRKPGPLVRTIWRYLDCYQFTGVIRLLERSGYEVTEEASC